MASLSLTSSPRRSRSAGFAGLGLGLATVLLLAACSDDSSTSSSDTTVPAVVPGAVPVAAGQAVLVDPIDGQAMIAAGGVTVIDVRTAAEFDSGHVEGAVNIDVEGGAFSAGIAELDPSATYVVYCQSGRRSALAATAMIDAGFTAVYDMGGIQDWLAAGLPVVAG